MDERHGAQRVVDAVLAVGERVFDRQHEAGAQLSERTAGVHERRRVGLEATLRHQLIELLGHFRDLLVGRPVAPIRLRDDRRHAPEEIFWLLHGLPLFVLHQVALFENGARIGGEQNGTRGRVDGNRHVDGTPRDGRRGTGDGRRATGDGRRATGDGRRAMGDGRRATGDGRRATGAVSAETESIVKSIVTERLV
jgi:hypothetical protein